MISPTYLSVIMKCFKVRVNPQDVCEFFHSFPLRYLKTFTEMRNLHMDICLRNLMKCNYNVKGVE